MSGERRKNMVLFMLCSPIVVVLCSCETFDENIAMSALFGLAGASPRATAGQRAAMSAASQGFGAAAQHRSSVETAKAGRSEVNVNVSTAGGGPRRAGGDDFYEGPCYRDGTPTGANYKGQTRNNTWHGFGTMSYADGCRYSGEWANGSPDGQGTYTRTDGLKYVGGWRNGKMHGQGTLTNKNESTTSGEWIYGRISGSHRMRWPDGKECYGEWSEDGKTGKGRMTWPDGTVYQGQWADPFNRCEENPEGSGTMIWPNGQKYEGEWEKGEMHGFGKLTTADGKVQAGFFQHSIFVGRLVRPAE